MKTILTGLAAVVLLATAAFVLGAGAAPDYERMQRSTVLVETVRDGQPVNKGAGVLTEHGVLTAAHLFRALRDGDEIRVRFYGGEYVTAEIERQQFETEIASNPYGGGDAMQARRDVALLSIPTTSGYPLSEVSCDKIGLGARVYQVGHPLAMEWTLTEGAVVSTRPRIGYPEGRWLAVSAITAPGNSGGPVYDANGRIIGIVSHSMIRGGLHTPAGSIVVPSGHHFAASGVQVCEFLAAA